MMVMPTLPRCGSPVVKAAGWLLGQVGKHGRSTLNLHSQHAAARATPAPAPAPSAPAAAATWETASPLQLESGMESGRNPTV